MYMKLKDLNNKKMKKVCMIFMFLVAMIQVTWSSPIAQVVWVESTKTLHFTYQEAVAQGSTFGGGTATSVWSGDDVTDTGTDDPQWRTLNKDIKVVKFDNSFQNVKPKSFYCWFWGCRFATFEGLEYLNTSEATSMHAMFYACDGLKSINLNTYDMSKVTNVTDMFWGCKNLKTIVCDSTLTIADGMSESMFWACDELKGNQAYDRQKSATASMANPVTGYFTTSAGVISGEGTTESPKLLRNAVHWEVLRNYIDAGKDSDLNFQMADNFAVTSMMGSSDHPFGGTFDGNNKLLTVNIVEGNADYVAPFAYIDGATLKGITVTGTVEGGRYSAGLVGQVKGGTNTVTDCYVMTEVKTYGSYAGGVIGNAGRTTLAVSGVLFTGKVTQLYTGWAYSLAGAIVGWCDLSNNITVSNCFEDGEYVGFSNIGMNWRLVAQGGIGGQFRGTTSYTTKDDFEASRVYEIKGAEGLVTPTPLRVAYSTALTFYGTTGEIGAFSADVVDEMEGGAIIDTDRKLYAAAGDVVKFTSQANVTSEDVTIVNNSQFTMPAKVVTLSVDKTPYAVWCAGNSTLYFTISSVPLAVGQTYAGMFDGQETTQLWSGNDVANVGWGEPKWLSISTSVAHVKIDAAFADIRPTSLFEWFFGMTQVTAIEGLEYLNTSEVTNMNSMFAYCSSLTSLDLNSFDMGKVTNTTTMFSNCRSLTTIYCGNTWDISTSIHMFEHCSSLVGATAYDISKTNGDMANPTTGYFTQPHDRVFAVWCNGNKTLYFTVPETALSEGGQYKGQTITAVWNGNNVVAHPQWNYDGLAGSFPEHVVIEPSFASAKPKSLAEWFKNFAKLQDITGIEYLNTSEVTSAAQMFANCAKLTSLDLTGFDMDKVSSTQQMFYGCNALTTIYCNDTWTPTTSAEMFYNCTSLKGAANFNANKLNKEMANPVTGYFTATKNLTQLANTEDWNRLATYVAAGNSCEDMTFTMTANFVAGNMIGTSEHPFSGTFNGGGHILTLKYGSANEPFDEDFCAPFRFVDGGTVENVIITGDIYTSKQYAASVMGQVYGYTMGSSVENVLSNVKIHSSFVGDGKIGGIIAYVRQNPYGGGNWSTLVWGCSFQGSFLGEQTNGVGGIVGWIEDSSLPVNVNKNLFAPREVTMMDLNSKTIIRNRADFFISNAFYTKTVGDAQGNKVYVITDESESAFIKNTTKDVFDVSMMIPHTGDDPIYITSIMAFILDEIEEDGDIEGEYQLLAAEGGTIMFESSANDLAVKAKDGTAVTLTGNVADGYEFVMPAQDVTITGGGKVAYAIWCNDSKTLYFDYSDTKFFAGGSYKDETITSLWSGNEVLNMGWSTPGWYPMADFVEKVVITEQFQEAKPTSIYSWFWDFINITGVEGLEYLNTSEVTNMNSTFYNCKGIKAIDVTSFDTNKVNNASAMFAKCRNLETIFCNNTWNIETTVRMFMDDEKLKSPNLTFTSQKDNGAYANPNNGYFTAKNLSLANAEDNSQTLQKWQGVKEVNVTLADRTLYKDDSWNTLCLPFDLSSDQIEDEECPLYGATIKTLDATGTYTYKGEEHTTGFDSNTGTLYLFFKDVDEIEAGKPYLVKWQTATDINEPLFQKVDISSAIADNASSDYVDFVGTYAPQTYTEENTSVLFLKANNTVYYPSGVNPASINAFRAFFTLKGIHAGTPASTDSNQARLFVLGFGEEEIATGIQRLTSAPSTKGEGCGYYTLDGRKVNGKPTLKGIYIHKGKKYVK